MSSSIENSHSDKSSSPSLTSCDNRTCSTAKCALCLHCSQQYCFVHFLKHNEQLSINALNLTLVIDQLEEDIQNLQLDECLRRTIQSLNQWRKTMIRNIESIYDEKLSSIKTNFLQLNSFVQRFQSKQISQIQTLRIDLEQMKVIRNTYDEDMNNIQMKIKQLQTNLSELQYDLDLKQNPMPNLDDLIECQIIWKTNDNIHENSFVSSSPNSYEHCLISFLTANDSKDDKHLSIDQIKNKKKRRICMNCGKCYHPSSLQRHYRQCKTQSILTNDNTTLKTVTNLLNQ